MSLTSLTSGGPMAIHHVLWRCMENKQLPVQIQLGARCRLCGALIDVMFRLNDMQAKPTRLHCPLCRAHDVHLISAKATAVER
jgi:Zn finger protein HypA/HybF involved in hydrogenase expression